MIYRLLIDVVGDEILVKEHYPLPIIPSADKHVRHYTGILGKHGATVTVADEESYKEICIDKQTVFEGNCTNVKAVHVFTEMQMTGKETAAAIIGQELYGMVSMIAGDENKLKALREYACLRADRKATVKEFMLDAASRKAMINFLAYYASCRMAEECIGGLEQLADLYNTRFARIQPVDVYRVESLLDMVGEALYLDENTTTPPYISWPSFLSAVAITRHCSVFDEAHDSAGQILLCLPQRVCIPTYWYIALLTETGISRLITDVMKHSCRGEKKVRGDDLLLQVLWAADRLPKKVMNRVLKRLFRENVSDRLLTTLKYLPENSAKWEICCKYIEKVHGEEYAQTVQTVVAMERERINRSLGIGGDKNGKTGTR